MVPVSTHSKTMEDTAERTTIPIVSEEEIVWTERTPSEMTESELLLMMCTEDAAQPQPSPLDMLTPRNAEISELELLELAGSPPLELMDRDPSVVLSVDDQAEETLTEIYLLFNDADRYCSPSVNPITVHCNPNDANRDGSGMLDRAEIIDVIRKYHKTEGCVLAP